MQGHNRGRRRWGAGLGAENLPIIPSFLITNKAAPISPPSPHLDGIFNENWPVNGRTGPIYTQRIKKHIAIPVYGRTCAIKVPD